MAMKILLATNVYTVNSGIPSYNAALLSILAKDYKISLLVNEDIKFAEGYDKVYSVKNVSSYSDVRKLLEELNNENFDFIINSFSPWLTTYTPFLSNNSKIITISHSLGTFNCDTAILNHKYVDKIISLSKSCDTFIKRRCRFLDPSKLCVVYNTTPFHNQADNIRERKKQKKTISIVFPGGSAPSKSPEIVVEILKKLCQTNLDFEFYWLGDKTPPLKKLQPYNDISLILPNDSRIKVTGRIPYSSASEIISECNILLAPSKREGFPMALLEAVSVGCIPIVADYDIANKEIIKNGINGYVCKQNNIDEFVTLICEIIKSHEKFHHIYDNSYQTFIEILSPPIWEQKMRRIFSDVDIAHVQRKSTLSRFNFFRHTTKINLVKFYDRLELFAKEVTPCAFKFINFYKNK